MGVPKFYRWLSERYPQINQMLSGTNVLPEFDNFYLDMNGIIHACTHPNDNPLANSLTMRDMILGIFRYIDRMVTEIVKPRKILFLAIDGVAPRAKLNQQRARRFRAAQERMESITAALERGEEVDEESMFDSNCITPGTEFMEQVGAHLRWFIRKKIKDDPLWRNLRIVFSGHDVPGEGEHKIMQFIRELRADPTYEPNQRHCMYGQDADLIMLGLASHEPHFALLREVIDFGSFKGGSSAKSTVIRQTKDVQFQLLHLSVLREYISLDFAYGCSAWVPNQERLIDDFIFLTFLVGNDFLPHLPTLDIGEHAFDTLINAYRQLMQEKEGYLVEDGELKDIERFEKLCAIIGQQEQTILENRAEEVRKMASKKSRFGGPKVSVEELEETEELQQQAFELALQEAMGGGRSGSAGGYAAGEHKEGMDGVEEEEELQWDGVVTSRRPAPKKRKGGADDEDGNGGSSGGGLIVNKDFRGRYYFEKFKIIASQTSGKDFLSKLMRDYLQGLMWCLAYYIKGCVSWTWYFPHHYGPMLQDMRQLSRYTGVGGTHAVTFSLGAPFLPFQQLLGCLPPASARLLPRAYQWLMISDDSPVAEFYPEDFAIDQDGKKNPWEAVVLLDFIDEKRLLAAEKLHCPSTKLSAAERARNVFGTVSTVTYDPAVWGSYPAPPSLSVRAGVNIAAGNLGLVDIPSCQSSATEETFDLTPGVPFRAELVPGTSYPIAGFPSLTTLPVEGFVTDFVKMNVFGSDSRYRSLVIKLKCPDVTEIEKLNAELLLGRSVYVNYPQTHEAKVVAVTSDTEEHRLVPSSSGDGSMVVRKTVFDSQTSRKWQMESDEQQQQYLKGRGVPGSGGLDIGPVRLRLRVCPLQGLKRDPVTGAASKVYSDSIADSAELQRPDSGNKAAAAAAAGSREMEADVPVQMAVWTPPVEDPRFEETGAMTVEQLLPYGSSVISVAGPLLGCKGKIVGPHGPTSAAVGGSNSNSNNKKKLAQPVTAASVVDVEFTVPLKAEPPFGYSIAAAVTTEYFSSKDLCHSLQISPSVLGKIVGSIRVEPGRLDLGLNLRRNGQYQLTGYARNVTMSNSNYNSNSSSSNKTSVKDSKEMVAGRKAWKGTSSTVVQVVGATGAGSADASAQAMQNAVAESEGSFWEYSALAAALIFDYKMNFPQLFANLEKLPHSPAYAAEQLLLPVPDEHNIHQGLSASGLAAKENERLAEWLKAQPSTKMPRSLLSSSTLPREAIAAIEQAGDVLSGKKELVTSDAAAVAKAEEEKFTKVVVKGVTTEQVYSAMHRGNTDVPLPYNVFEPKLGDRVANLSTPGVPFTLKGTVVTIHSNTQYVEVVFDEEFLAGRALSGNCSQFRGKLCAWSSLLLTSRKEEYLEFRKKNKQQLAQAQAQRNATANSGGTGSAAAGGAAPPTLTVPTGILSRDGHVRGQFPVPTSVQLKQKQRAAVATNTGNVASTVKILQPSRTVGPAVTVATTVPPAVKYVEVAKVPTADMLEKEATAAAAAPAFAALAAASAAKKNGQKQKKNGKADNAPPTATAAAATAAGDVVVTSEKAEALKFALQQRHAVNSIMAATASATAIDSEIDMLGLANDTNPYTAESSINLLLNRDGSSGGVGSARASDGSGLKALMMAAGGGGAGTGTGADDDSDRLLLPPASSMLEHNMLAGVVSFDYIQSKAAAAAAAAAAVKPPVVTGAAAETGSALRTAPTPKTQGQRTTSVDKAAALRVLKHELAGNNNHVAAAATSNSKKDVKPAATASYGKKISVTAILSNPANSKNGDKTTKKKIEGSAAGGAVGTTTAGTGTAGGGSVDAITEKLAKAAIADSVAPADKVSIMDKLRSAKKVAPAAKSTSATAPTEVAPGKTTWANIAKKEDSPAAATDTATDTATTAAVKPEKKQSAASLLKNAKKALAAKGEKAAASGTTTGGTTTSGTTTTVTSAPTPPTPPSAPILDILKKATKLPAAATLPTPPPAAAAVSSNKTTAKEKKEEKKETVVDITSILKKATKIPAVDGVDGAPPAAAAAAAVTTVAQKHTPVAAATTSTSKNKPRKPAAKKAAAPASAPAVVVPPPPAPSAAVEPKKISSIVPSRVLLAKRPAAVASSAPAGK